MYSRYIGLSSVKKKVGSSFRSKLFGNRLASSLPLYERRQRKSYALVGVTTISAAIVSINVVHHITGKPASEHVLQQFPSAEWARKYRVMTTFARLAIAYKWLQLLHGSKADYPLRLSELHQRGAEQVLQVCRQNGGILVKVGQHAVSLRPAIPEEYIEVLSVLQDKALQDSLEDVVNVMKDELNDVGGVDNFSWIDPTPLGVASLAQVHRCTLKETGERVAVKVQHKSVATNIANDFQMLRSLNSIAGQVFPGFSLQWALDELYSNLQEELDFTLEAQNAKRIRELVAKDSFLANKVWVPMVFEKLSTTRILVMEMVEGGIPIRDVPALEEHGIILSDVRETILELFGRMFFTWGFIHCDPHPGNLMIVPPRKDGTVVKPAKLALLDHGLYYTLDSQRRVHLCGLWRSLVLQDRHQLMHHCNALGIAKFEDILPILLTNRMIDSNASLGSKLDSAEARNARSSLQQVSLADMNDELPPDLLFVLRTMHLIKDLNEEILGGSKADRFNTYFSCALYGQWRGAIPSESETNLWRLLSYSIDLSRMRLWLYLKHSWSSVSDWWYGDGDQKLENVSILTSAR